MLLLSTISPLVCLQFRETTMWNGLRHGMTGVLILAQPSGLICHCLAGGRYLKIKKIKRYRNYQLLYGGYIQTGLAKYATEGTDLVVYFIQQMVYCGLLCLLHEAQG